MKVHAKDYLVEMACSKGTPAWLSYIVYGVLKNGDLSEASLKKFLDWFENNPDKEFDQTLLDSLSNKHAVGREIKLIKLIHHSGVNALTCDGEIKFCKDITVLYGGNGSGKSGYFRILNEIIGGGVPHQILPNVYEQGKPISVTLEYETNGQTKSLHWTGKRGDGSSELELKVFDGYYASTLIARRTIDMAAVEPLGLHLFGLVTEKIDCFKRIVSDKINVLINQLPHIDTSNLSEDIRSLVENKLLTRDEYKKRVEPIEFTTEEDKRLAVVQSRIVDLQQQEVQPTIRYKQLIRNTLSSIKQELRRQVQQLEVSVAEWNKVLSQYADTYNAAKSARGQYSVLNGIPGSDSDLWKQFIQNGVEYSRQYEQEYGERCPYCHQSLKNDLHAIDLVKGYVAFLSDKSQRQCEIEWAKLQKLQNRIKAFSIGCSPLQTLAQVVAGRDTENFSGMQQRIENYVASLRKGKFQFDADVEQLRVTAVSVMQGECTQIEMQLTAEMTRIDEEIKLLTNGALARKGELNKLKEEQSLLLRRQEVVRLKPQLDKFCVQIDALSYWNKFYASISSRRISDLSRVAHNDLLTEKLQKKFSAWFGQFGFKNLKISLEVVSAHKSIPQTELRITGVDKVIPLVLSEGEQKAAALAMFLAETEMQCDSAPLVFDDPVNSLDHRVIAAFAHMLLMADRQIIVFTHNRLFLDSFRASNKIAHFCKNFTNGCTTAGKHIYLWEVAAVNRNTGCIMQGEGDSAQDILCRMRTKLKVLLSDDARLSVAASFRRAVEKLIDEVLLKNVQPCKWNISGNHIEWDKLKGISQDGEYQRQWAVLNKAFGCLSNKELHEGEMSRENPITQDELSSVCNDLSELCDAK